MNHLLRIAFMLLSFIAFSRTFAQQYAMKESTSLLENPYHEFFATGNNEYIDVSFMNIIDKRKISISCFDANMKQLYTNPVAQLSGKRYRTGIYSNNKLFVFCTDEDLQLTRYEIDCKTGNQVGNAVPLFSYPGDKKLNLLYRGSSAGKKYHYIICEGRNKSEKTEVFAGAIMDAQMNIVTQFTYTTPVKVQDVAEVSGILSDNGELCLIYGAIPEKQSGPIDALKYTMIYVDKSGKARAGDLAAFPDGDFRNISWQLKGNTLQFAGLLRLKKKEGFRSMVMGEIDPAQQKILSIKKEENLAGFLVDQGPNHVRFEKDAIPLLAVLDTSFIFSDGSRAMILEERIDDNQRWSPQGALGPSVPTQAKLYFAWQVFVIKLSKENAVEWIQVIAKDQGEELINFYTGIACFADEKDGMHILFHDAPKNVQPEPGKKDPLHVSADGSDAGLASVLIDQKGTMKKQFITLKREDEFGLSPLRSVSFRKNELVYLSIDYKGFQVAGNVTNIYNKSRYRLGTIKFQQ